jgi:ribonuclease HII
MSESARLKKMFLNELRLQKEGFSAIAGIDEAGRGPLAGPVVSACCILPKGVKFAHLNDSKQLTPEVRTTLFEQITSHPNVHYGIAVIDVETIDAINILQATLLGMQKAAQMLDIDPDYFLVDGNKLPFLPKPAEAIIEGDAKSLSIAAASILAKVTRDRIMENLGAQYPLYLLEQNKGYATDFHMHAIFTHGPSEIHRKSFDPVKSLLQPTLF